MREPSTELQQAIDEALRAMRSHPRYILLPWYRHAIYQQVKKLSNANGPKQSEPPLYEGGKRVPGFGNRVRGWLAILAAEKVLPIWNSGTPKLKYLLGEDTPQELLTVARGVISGEVDGKEGFEQTAGAHETIGHLDDEARYSPEVFPLNCVFAAEAAEHALVEAIGWYVYEHWYDDSQKQWLRAGLDQVDSKAWEQLTGYSTPEEVNIQPAMESERESWILVGDTAGTAARAFSCGHAPPIYEPERLEEFWTWWLTEAIPQAWELATAQSAGSEDQGQEPHQPERGVNGATS